MNLSPSTRAELSENLRLVAQAVKVGDPGEDTALHELHAGLSRLMPTRPAEAGELAPVAVSDDWELNSDADDRCVLTAHIGLPQARSLAPLLGGSISITATRPATPSEQAPVVTSLKPPAVPVEAIQLLEWQAARRVDHPDEVVAIAVVARQEAGRHVVSLDTWVNSGRTVVSASAEEPSLAEAARAALAKVGGQ